MKRNSVTDKIQIVLIKQFFCNIWLCCLLLLPALSGAQILSEDVNIHVQAEKMEISRNPFQSHTIKADGVENIFNVKEFAGAPNTHHVNGRLEAYGRSGRIELNACDWEHIRSLTQIVADGGTVIVRRKEGDIEIASPFPHDPPSLDEYGIKTGPDAHVRLEAYDGDVWLSGHMGFINEFDPGGSVWIRGDHVYTPWGAPPVETAFRMLEATLSARGGMHVRGGTRLGGGGRPSILDSPDMIIGNTIPATPPTRVTTFRDKIIINARNLRINGSVDLVSEQGGQINICIQEPLRISGSTGKVRVKIRDFTAGHVERVTIFKKPYVRITDDGPWEGPECDCENEDNNAFTKATWRKSDVLVPQEKEVVTDKKEDRNNNQATVYPNPFTDQLNIPFFVQQGDEGLINVLIYNQQGHLVKQQRTTVSKSGLQILSFTTGDLPAGVYFVRATNQQGKALLQQKAVKL